MNKITIKNKNLLLKIRELILSARTAAVRSVNTLQVLTNFEIGRLIVEHEQAGAKRAAYGKKLLKELSAILTKEFGKGFSLTNLKLIRRFFVLYSPVIGRTLSDQLEKLGKGQTASDQSQIMQTPSAQMKKGNKSSGLFTLSWSHYVFLMGLDDDQQRSFYEIETSQQNWSLRELKRQFDSGLYERLALSRDKKGIKKLAQEGQVVSKPEDVFKEPYVLEFLGIDEKTKYSESDLETAIINKLEHFLLELGKGFLFEARQKRFTFDEEHFFIDLVFYNRLLQCYVLIDLKIGKLTHQDLGQMQMYVNYFDRHVKKQDEHPTVGIILCKKKHDVLVEITLPKDTAIYAKEYKLYLPSKAELRRKLIAWSEEEGKA